MFLKGEHISLRALEPSDANLLYHWENDVTLWPVSFTQIPFSKFVLEEFVNTSHNDIYTNKQLRLMVVNNQNHETIGIADLFEFEPQHLRCGLGILIQKEYRKKGAASECLELLKHYCFKTLLLNQIHVHVNVSNSASLALFEKAGFTKIGLIKAWNRTGINTFEDVWFLQFVFSSE